MCVLTVCRFKVALKEICSRVWFASFLKRQDSLFLASLMSKLMQIFVYFVHMIPGLR